MPTTNHYFLKNIKEATEDFYLTKGLIRRKLDLELPYDRFISEVGLKLTFIYILLYTHKFKTIISTNNFSTYLKTLSHNN